MHPLILGMFKTVIYLSTHYFNGEHVLYLGRWINGQNGK